jgi:hypothetical protein
MDRRDFFRYSFAGGAALLLSDWEKAFALGRKHIDVGKPWRGWKEGEFQIHFIYTGVAESIFLIFPDGTSMLLDCGDFDALARGAKAVPLLPSNERHAGEWIARYVTRVNPAVTDVDYMMLSHYHNDHAGSDLFHAGKVVRDGKEYALSGFAQAAEILNFRKAIDRCYPDDDPSLNWADPDTVRLMYPFYDYMKEHRGMQVEKFRLGATDQIVQLHDPYPGFSVWNLCGNGCIAYPDGRTRDLFEAKKKAGIPAKNENAMSLGLVFSYGTRERGQGQPPRAQIDDPQACRGPAFSGLRELRLGPAAQYESLYGPAGRPQHLSRRPYHLPYDNACGTPRKGRRQGLDEGCRQGILRRRARGRQRGKGRPPLQRIIHKRRGRINARPQRNGFQGLDLLVRITELT